MNRFALLLLLPCLMVAACRAPAPKPDARYPLEVPGFGEYQRFPLTAAGYARGMVLTYEPGMVNYSVAYNVRTPYLDVVTLYFYGDPARAPLAQEFEIEKREIMAAHPGAELLAESSLTLYGNGTAYQARVATFRYVAEIVPGQPRPVFSEFVLASLPTRYFKVRSTSWPDDAAEAQAGVRRLLDAVGWAP
ncbi:MAG: hypothetical protein ACREVL_01680 [Solimonas sp.]